MNSFIKLLSAATIGLIFGFSAPVSASDCTPKVLFSELFRSESSDGIASINEVELCTNDVLMVQSKIPITEIVTSKSNAITVSPVSNFAIIIHPVVKQELVVSFFSGTNKEFIILKIVDAALESTVGQSDASPSLEDDAVILPVLISDVNIKSEGLRAGDLVDVMLVSEQVSDKIPDRRIPQSLARRVKVFSISPSSQDKLGNNLDSKGRQKLSWAFLTLSPMSASQIDKVSTTGSIILLQSEKSDSYTTAALVELSKKYDREQINNPGNRELSEYNAKDELEVELLSKKNGSNDPGVQTITIFRGGIEKKINCNVTCSEAAE